MTSVHASLPCTWSQGNREHLFRGRYFNVQSIGYLGLDSSANGSVLFKGKCAVHGCYRSTLKRWQPLFSSARNDGPDPDDSGDGIDEDSSSQREAEAANNETNRENLERLVGKDDSAFSGIDLATLIRSKYGKSYDVQFIKKEFMGKNFLALNVMWKYREQRSFPLTEEEYLLRLDDVANTLKCWGAVSHIRNSLQKSKERPRIGKAVSIFIDMDESGGRANEWIYK